jgi:hypothetical protein
MIDHIIASLVLIVVILLVIIAFLTFYIIYERRKTTILPLNKFVPLLTYDKSSGDHSNSATHKRITKRLRQRVRLDFFSRNDFSTFPSSQELYLFVLKIPKDFFSQTVISLLINSSNKLPTPLSIRPLFISIIKTNKQIVIVLFLFYKIRTCRDHRDANHK